MAITPDLSIASGTPASTGGSGGEANAASPTPSTGTTAAPNSTTPTQTEQTAQSKNSISNGDLPWATVLLPTTSAGHSGIGQNRHDLQPETWVWGFFMDNDMQHPVVMGVFPGGPGGGSGSTPGSGDGTGAGSSGSSGASSGSSSSDNTPITTTKSSAGGAGAKKVFDLLVQKGYTKEQAAGIVGNLLREGKNPSTGDLSATQREIGHENRGYGIAQWTSQDRKNRLLSRPNHNTLEGQVDFLDWELKNTEPRAYRLLQNAAHSVDDSAIAFLEAERPGGYSPALARATGGSGFARTHSEVKNRVSSARAVYKAYGGGNAGT